MRGRGSFQVARESSIAALIIAVMLACSISFTIIVQALPGDLIWTKTVNPSSAEDWAFSVAVDDSGVYVVGWDEKPGNERWRIEKRSTTDGSILWKKASNPSSGEDRAFGVAVDGTGVYIVGHDFKPGNARWRIEKRDPADGSLLWKKTSNPSSGEDEAIGVAVDGSGVYIVGYDEKHGDRRWRMEKRSTKDGSLIWKKASNPSSNFDVAFRVAVDSTGAYIVGYDYKSGSRWRMEKRGLADGSLIWKKISKPTSGADMARGVATDGTGVYSVGYDYNGGTDWRWRMEKRNPTDGSLIWKKTSNPSSDWDRAYCVAVDSSGLYIVGIDMVKGNTRWRIEKRSLIDGSLIWKKTTNPSSGEDWALGVATDGTGVYIVGYDDRLDNYRWRMEKRYS